MFKTISYYGSVALCNARLVIQKQIEYPLFLVSYFIINPIGYFVGILFLYILVNKFQPLAGWTFPQLAFVYGLGDLSHGLMVVFAIQTWNIEGYVTRGEFDRMLLRPMNVFFQFITNYINFIGLTDIFTGGIIFAIGCKLVNFQWTLVNAIEIIVVVFSAAIIRSSIYTIFCSIAFWTNRSRSLVGVIHDSLERTTLYPLSIYPQIIQIIFTFLIPVGFISFYPACEFLGQNSRTSLPLGLAIWTPIVAVIMFFLAGVVFNWGLKNYSSAGS